MNRTDNQLYRRLTPGTVLTCVENTYRPWRAGEQRIVIAVRGRKAECRTQTDQLVSVPLPPARHVTWLDGNTARWPLASHPGDFELVGHTVTFRIEPAVPAGEHQRRSR